MFYIEGTELCYEDAAHVKHRIGDVEDIPELFGRRHEGIIKDLFSKPPQSLAEKIMDVVEELADSDFPENLCKILKRIGD